MALSPSTLHRLNEGTSPPVPSSLPIPQMLVLDVTPGEIFEIYIALGEYTAFSASENWCRQRVVYEVTPFPLPICLLGVWELLGTLPLKTERF